MNSLYCCVFQFRQCNGNITTVKFFFASAIEICENASQPVSSLSFPLFCADSHPPSPTSFFLNNYSFLPSVRPKLLLVLPSITPLYLPSITQYVFFKITIKEEEDGDARACNGRSNWCSGQWVCFYSVFFMLIFCVFSCLDWLENILYFQL